MSEYENEEHANALMRVSESGLDAVDMSLIGDSAEAAKFRSAVLDNVGTGGAILKYSGKTGVFSHRDEVVEHGSRLAFMLSHAEEGWVCWKGGKIVDRRWRKLLSRMPKILEDDLPDHGPFSREGEGWTQAVRVTVRRLEDGMQFELMFSSKSGISTLMQLFADYVTKARMKEEAPGVFKTPIVEIGAEPFTTQKAAGRIWAPRLTIVDWMGQAEIDELMAQYEVTTEDEYEAEPEPPKPSRIAGPAVGRRPRIST